MAINKARQISQLWFWAHQLQLPWMKTTANGHMTALTVKHSLLEFSSGNKPFQADWILLGFLRKRTSCRNFLKTIREESNHREERWSVLWFSHNQKKNQHTLNWSLFLDVHKVKFDIAATSILRPKQLWSTRQQFHAVLTQENSYRKRSMTAQGSLAFKRV